MIDFDTKSSYIIRYINNIETIHGMHAWNLIGEDIIITAMIMLLFWCLN